MERFMVSPTEGESTGVEIPGEPGLRLMAGEWMAEWMCREEGVAWTPVQEDERQEKEEGRNFKLVLAEPLNNHPHSHVNKFLGKLYYCCYYDHFELFTHNCYSVMLTFIIK